MTLKWDTRFLELAKHISTWSRDPSTQVGAVIVDAQNRIVSVGFNGLPKGIEDDERLHDKDFKYGAIVHAEVNAILFAGRQLSGCTLYTHPFPPCSNCASIVIQSGISRIVSADQIPERWKKSMETSMQLFKEAGIEVSFMVSK